MEVDGSTGAKAPSPCSCRGGGADGDDEALGAIDIDIDEDEDEDEVEDGGGAACSKEGRKEARRAAFVAARDGETPDTIAKRKALAAAHEIGVLGSLGKGAEQMATDSGVSLASVEKAITVNQTGGVYRPASEFVAPAEKALIAALLCPRGTSPSAATWIDLRIVGLCAVSSGGAGESALLFMHALRAFMSLKEAAALFGKHTAEAIGDLHGAFSFHSLLDSLPALGAGLARARR